MNLSVFNLQDFCPGWREHRQTHPTVPVQNSPSAKSELCFCINLKWCWWEWHWCGRDTDESLEEFESLVILLQMWLYRPQSLSLEVTRIPFSNISSTFTFSPEVQESLVPLAQFIQLFLGNFCATSKWDTCLHLPVEARREQVGPNWRLILRSPVFSQFQQKPNFSTAATAADT